MRRVSRRRRGVVATTPPLSRRRRESSAYLVVGIEEVGIELEAPFTWCPLQELAARAMADVVDEVCPLHPAPPLSTVWTPPARRRASTSPDLCI